MTLRRGTEEAFIRTTPKVQVLFVPKRNNKMTRTRTLIGRVPHTGEPKRGVRGVLGGTATCVVRGD